jgi:hypothetical protein
MRLVTAEEIDEYIQADTRVTAEWRSAMHSHHNDYAKYLERLNVEPVLPSLPEIQRMLDGHARELAKAPIPPTDHGAKDEWLGQLCSCGHMRCVHGCDDKTGKDAVCKDISCNCLEFKNGTAAPPAAPKEAEKP